MRNFSMKKFGTPSGAAPASARENVGLSTVGVPSLARVWPFGRRFGLTSSARGWPSGVPLLPLGRGLAFSPPDVIGPVPCFLGEPPGHGECDQQLPLHPRRQSRPTRPAPSARGRTGCRAEHATEWV